MRIVDERETDSNRIDPVRYGRPIISSLHTWDEDTKIDYHSSIAAIGRRPLWNVPSLAVTSESVNTIRSSVNLKFTSPQVPPRAGILFSPRAAPPVYRPVPNMAQAIRTDSSVQVSFHLNLQSTLANDSPFFAVFRDGRQISQHYRVQGGAANVDFSISGTYTDPNPPMGWHVYDLRWRLFNSTAVLTAMQNNRTFQASNLRAQ